MRGRQSGYHKEGRGTGEGGILQGGLGRERSVA